MQAIACQVFVCIALFSLLGNCERGNIGGDKVIIIIPGLSISDGNRTHTVLHNLRLLHEQRNTSDYHCLVHYYSTNPVASAAVLNMFQKYSCTLQFFDAETFQYAHFLKSLSPSLVYAGGFSHVLVLLDDVELHPTFSLDSMQAVMNRNNLSVASPAVRGASMASTLPYTHSTVAKRFRMPPLYSLGTTTRVIEVFATLFTAQAWACFWDLLEPQWNAAGWGYDLCLYHYCLPHIPGLAMGVVYTMTATHHTEFGRIAVGRTGGNKHPGHQFDLWRREMKSKRNVTLKPVMKHSRGKRLLP